MYNYEYRKLNLYIYIFEFVQQTTFCLEYRNINQQNDKIRYTFI